MKTVAYDGEAVPWSRDKHFRRTRLLLSSYNNFSGTLTEQNSSTRSQFGSV
jgi:hypothetical protein